MDDPNSTKRPSAVPPVTDEQRRQIDEMLAAIFQKKPVAPPEPPRLPEAVDE